jgi:hypothetical protein
MRMVCQSKFAVLPVLFLLLLCLCYHQGRSQSENGSSRLRIDANAGLIINNAFSNITEKEERPDESSIIVRAPSDSGSNVKVGFFLGADFLLGRKENLKSVFGLSFSRTGAEYHYSYLEQLRTSRLGFTTLTRTTEHDIIEIYNAINIHAGLRKRLASGFFLTGSFIFHNPVRIRRITDGYTKTVYTTNGPDTETFIEYVKDEEKKYNRGELNLSLRFNAEYEFKMNGTPARVFMFRNFGLIYTLPWWGFGVAYTVKN